MAHRSQGRPRTDQRACFIPLLKRAGATFHALDFSELLLLQQESTFVHYLRTVKYPDWPGWNYIRRRLLKHAKNHSRLERQEKLVCFVMPISWKIWLPSSKLTYGVATSCFFSEEHPLPDLSESRKQWLEANDLQISPTSLNTSLESDCLLNTSLLSC